MHGLRRHVFTFEDNAAMAEANAIISALILRLEYREN